MWILGLKGLKRDPWIFHFSSTIPMDVYGSWFVDVNSLLTFMYQGTMISTHSNEKQKLFCPNFVLGSFCAIKLLFTPAYLDILECYISFFHNQVHPWSNPYQSVEEEGWYMSEFLFVLLLHKFQCSQTSW